MLQVTNAPKKTNWLSSGIVKYHYMSVITPCITSCVNMNYDSEASLEINSIASRKIVNLSLTYFKTLKNV